MKSYMISEAPYALRGGREETAESTAQTEQASVANVSTHGIKHHSSTSMIVPSRPRPRPRPQNFVLEVSSRSRPVLEDPIPDSK